MVVVVAQLATVSGTLRSGRFNNLTGPAANGNRVEKPHSAQEQPGEIETVERRPGLTGGMSLSLTY